MTKNIIITGAAGFIASYLANYIDRVEDQIHLILVDDFEAKSEFDYVGKIAHTTKVDRSKLFDWLVENPVKIDAFYHLGARTDTACFDMGLLETLNIDYSKKVWNYCVENSIPLVYASSAATYGDGALGFVDSHEIVDSLQPLNPYGHSKNDFDKWVLSQDRTPPKWYGVKFFNVFGPNEYHKSRMASVVFHAYNQINKTGAMKLFRSHKEGIENGHQSRDFIYVKDVCKVCHFLMEFASINGLYNVGTGEARTFLDLTKAVFNALEINPEISFIDTPIDIRDKYQYYTCADVNKLKAVGYTEAFTSLEDGITEYVCDYLKFGKYY